MSELPVIDSFSGPNRFLSNFWPCKKGVKYEGRTYRSSEHAYVAAKTLDEKLREEVVELVTPRDVKAFGRTITLREDWEQVKFGEMRKIVHAKFEVDLALIYALLSTNGHLLVEGNTWHDNIWGNCTCARCANVLGHNALGVILMETRLNLLAEGRRI
ncbi:hypothetical protein SEA_SIXAMA_22 [Gordonia phage Sixama]|uniref:NADAR domain-containing protein n=1 Tax=Gordonia phage Sixama TaxID=2653271 RepID=A0A5Q2F1S5_9CAUD|nr:hypothetical protein PP302_gp022 [Gordonia phage Sixama]QGF20201.1 hypothetical protein SEA_SIXAMA_22 [Gordonia phage Sixama]